MRNRLIMLQNSKIPWLNEMSYAEQFRIEQENLKMRFLALHVTADGMTTKGFGAQTHPDTQT